MLSDYRTLRLMHEYVHVCSVYAHYVDVAKNSKGMTKTFVSSRYDDVLTVVKLKNEKLLECTFI